MDGESMVGRGRLQRPLLAAVVAGLFGATLLAGLSAAPSGPTEAWGASQKGVKITKVKLIPHRGWVYADGYLDMKVQVTNRGRQIARGTDVFLTSSRKKVKVPRRIRIHQILPKWTVTKTFRVRPRRNVRGYVQIEARTEGLVNRSVLKLIKPWW